MNIIIGAGPAGLGAALAMKKPALILERNSFAGKKLLLSGSGQCNVTNAAEAGEFLNRLGEFKSFLKPAFYKFSNLDLMKLLQEAGCPLVTRVDAKVFPLSRHSADIRDTLLKLVLERGHKVLYKSKIISVRATARGFDLQCSSGSNYQAQHLILAAGGAAYPQTGSDGSAYALATSLGHSVLAPRPALASVSIKNFLPFRDCSGLGISGATIKYGKSTFQGDLLFTHQGFSGPLILDNVYRMKIHDRIALVLDPSGCFENILFKNPRKKLSSILTGIGLSRSLSEAILRHLDLPDQAASELRATQRKALGQWLQHAEFEIAAIADLSDAMSDYGGVSLKEVKAGTMQSKLVPGLYLAGESLAYSLPSGGFSIQMAMSTGYLAGTMSE